MVTITVDGDNLSGTLKKAAYLLRRGHMKETDHSLAQNFVIRFINVTRKKEGIFANFKVKGVRGGAYFASTISVDIKEAEVEAADTLEKIIEECARIAVNELKRATFQFEGMAMV